MRDEIPSVGAVEGDETAEGVRLRYVQMCSGSPAVVLIHGASGNLSDMTFQLAPLIARDRTVVAFDRPGHGHSGWPDRGGEQLAVQARLMRQALAGLGIERAVLVGHSYGGSVALAWALDAPESVEGLVLVGAPSQGWKGGMGLANDLLAHPLTAGLMAYSLPMVLTPAFVARSVERIFAPQKPPAGYVKHLRMARILNPEALRANAVQLHALKTQLLAMVPRYGTLPMPVEILHGTADQTVPFGMHALPLASQIPGAALRRLDGIGHMPHHVAPAEILAALRRL